MLKRSIVLLVALSISTITHAFQLPPEGPTTKLTADCINRASQRYSVPPLLILAILRTEGGKPGLAMRNTNGTYDLGPMQVNTLWVKRKGINAQQLRDNACFNVHVGTAILASEIQQAGDLAKGIGNYHSRTPKHHYKYRRLVTRSLKKIRKQVKNKK